MRVRLALAPQGSICAGWAVEVDETDGKEVVEENSACSGGGAAVEDGNSGRESLGSPLAEFEHKLWCVEEGIRPVCRVPSVQQQSLGYHHGTHTFVFGCETSAPVGCSMSP